jgi:hypothetical protein
MLISGCQGEDMHRAFSSSLRSLILSLLALLSAGKAEGQVDFTLQFEARSVSGFGFLNAIRPMSDGRVLVADPLGGVVVVVNLDDQTADTLGRSGGGPQEYRSPDSAFPLPGDSTLLVDMGNGRLIVMAPNGTFARTMPITRQNDHGQLTISIPRFVDQEGHLYFQPEEVSGGPLPDSANIVRIDLAGRKVDTLGAIKLSDSSPQSGKPGVSLGRTPLGARDDWAVSPDGTVAIVRAEGYRVEWTRPGSRTVVGPGNTYDRVRIGRREEEAWMEDFFSASISIGIRRRADGSRTVNLSRGTPGGGTLDLDQIRFPAHLPPFRAGRSLVSSEGDLWVERYGSAGSSVTIDVFSRLGQKEGELEIPEGRRLAGFGVGVVYLVHKDALGLQWLERYRVVKG